MTLTISRVTISEMGRRVFSSRKYEKNDMTPYRLTAYLKNLDTISPSSSLSL
jgi:hypothetical protein